MSKQAATFTSIDILGNTWTARHLARQLLAAAAKPSALRLWNDSKNSTTAQGVESIPKMMLVPSFLKDHRGLGFRTNVETTIIHHHRRQRDKWTTARETAKNLNCCPEVMALLYDLIFFNSYGASVLVGQKLKVVNFDWQKTYEAVQLDGYTPGPTVLASKTSIERVWDNTLEHDGAELHYLAPMRVESVREPTSSAGLALILSAPHGAQDDTDHVVKTTSTGRAQWYWKSYQCVVSRELVASIPRFFVWIDDARGEDFLATGLLYDGAILRVTTVPLPQSDEKILVQVDRLTARSASENADANHFFAGSPWHALTTQEWAVLAANSPDDDIYGASSSPLDVIKKLKRKPISSLGISTSGPEHHVIT